MGHIAVCVPAGTGHVNPTLGLAAELVARGHRVTYAATAAHAAAIADVGAEVVTYRTKLTDGAPPQFSARDFPSALGSALTEAQSALAQVLPAFGADVPDLVVHDGTMAWWGRLAAARWQTPVVACWPNFVGNRHWSLNRYVKINPVDPRLLRMLWRTHRLARRYGLTALNLLQSAGADAQLVFLPRAFQFAGDTFGPPYAFVGPCLTERPSDGSWRPPPRRDVVLVALGTGYHDRTDFYRTCLDAFAATAWHVVLVLGDRVDPAALGTVPDNVELHRSVPQLQVLRHAAAFVSHAGMGSTMEALTLGVPIVAVPQMTEQRANADRIAELGLGRHLTPAEVTPARLRDAVTDVSTDAHVRSALRAMQDQIRVAGGAAAAADIVERAASNARRGG
ncbi:macrolide family glycosyltransferase [Mycolicibacterium vaccae]|uniref:macrolide family glycosyltransferase n=1 Tax=Mycolicibacterium vaccae TaxID=1810 RepID=UPI003D031C94